MHQMTQGRVRIYLVPTCRCPSFPDEEAVSPIGMNFAAAEQHVGFSRIALTVDYQVIARCPECGAFWDILNVSAI